jgi:hypothetical protein
MLRVAAGPVPASRDTASTTSNRASLSRRKKSISLALARQFTGVTIRPRNWQAQWMVAASQRFWRAMTTWSPRPRPEAFSRAATVEMRRYHCR